ncbi:MAG: hypothetical protein ABIH20_02670 [Candidatus Diapherotrites archaeon]
MINLLEKNNKKHAKRKFKQELKRLIKLRNNSKDDKEFQKYQININELSQQQYGGIQTVQKNFTKCPICGKPLFTTPDSKFQCKNRNCRLYLEEISRWKAQFGYEANQKTTNQYRKNCIDTIITAKEGHKFLHWLTKERKPYYDQRPEFFTWATKNTDYDIQYTAKKLETLIHK